MTGQTSFHEHFRALLSWVTSAAWRRRIVAACAQAHPQWDISVPWLETFGRFNPLKDPVITLLLEQPDCSTNQCLIHIHTRPPVPVGKGIHWHEPESGWVQVWGFPDDPVMPQLGELLSVYQKDGPTIHRYRPGKRCTFSIHSPAMAGRIFGKVFADGRGRAIHEESLMLWYGAEANLLDFTVAKPIRWDPANRVMWQHPVAGGSIIHRLLGKQGIALAERMGAAAGSIPGSGLTPKLRYDGLSQLQRTAKYVRRLVRILPDQSSRLANLLDTLETIHTSYLGQSRLKPLHGAPHAHQWLDCGDCLGLVDFDRFCLGDPEMDAATFIAEMDFEDRQSVPVDAINQAFLETYQRRAGRLEGKLLQAYRCHKRLAKALKSAAGLDPDGDNKARRHLDYAFRALTEPLP